jgi:predicted nucleic acid-binding protein
VIVLDTSIISTFALIGAMDLLYALFPNDDLGVTPAVYTELVVGAREGRQFLQAAVEQVESDRLKLFVLTAEEFMQRLRLPTSLGSGEAESIVLCQSRGAAFVTNDRRARNFCLSEGIEVFDLIEVLRALWRLGVCSKQQVQQLAIDIESKEGAVIRRKGAIFTK